MARIQNIFNRLITNENQYTDLLCNMLCTDRLLYVVHALTVFYFENISLCVPVSIRVNVRTSLSLKYSSNQSGFI